MAVDDISKVNDLIKRIDELNSMSVKVGITSKAGGEMLMIANVQEFGCDIEITPKMRGYFLYNFGVALRPDKRFIHIPERSFIRSSFDSKSEKIYKSGEELLAMVVDGGLSIRNYYTMLGETAADAIRDYLINEVKEPPKSDLTVKIEHGKTNPLVNNGQLAAAINYEIVGG